MIENVGHQQRAGLSAPVCVAVRAAIARSAYEDLRKAGAADVVSCNTIIQSSNRISPAAAIAAAVRAQLLPGKPTT